MAKGRPGGNPELKKYQFTTDREDPLVEKMTLRVGAKMKAALKAGELEDWQEVARVAIASALEKKRKEKTPH